MAPQMALKALLVPGANGGPSLRKSLTPPSLVPSRVEICHEGCFERGPYFINFMPVANIDGVPRVYLTRRPRAGMEISWKEVPFSESFFEGRKKLMKDREERIHRCS